MEVSQNQIYEGQSVLYRITVNHVNNPPRPELGSMVDFDVAPRGEQSLDSTQVFIINGRRTEIVRRGRQYDYLLTPRKTGELRIPSPTLQIDGAVLQGRAIPLRVIASSEQDLVAVAVSADRSTVLPLQPFTVTVSVAVKEVASQPELNPLTVQADSLPVLRIPWVPDDRLPKGLAPAVACDDWLRSLADRQGQGLSINEIPEQPVSLLFRSELLGFRPKAKKVQRPDKNGRAAAYWQYDFARVLTADKLGRYEFGPVTLEGHFATGTSAAGRLVGETVYAVGRKIAVAVEDAPEPGRPEFYLRAFGRFEALAELVPQRVRTGDPMTLTLTITGRGTLQDAVAPDLTRLPEIAQRFKIYEATQEIRRGSCRFTYGLRPLRDGKDAFPAIRLASYDPHAQQYHEFATEPIAIEVLKAERLSGEQIVSGGAGPSADRKQLEAWREGIFANVTDPQQVRNEAVRPLRWLAGLGGAVGLYALAAALVLEARRRTGDKAALRRRAAVGRASQRLRHGLAALQAQQHREGAEMVRDAVAGLVADVADLAEAGLTPKDVHRQMALLGVDDQTLGQLGRLLERCDAARYGDASRDLEGLAQQAQEAFERAVRALRAKGRLR